MKDLSILIPSRNEPNIHKVIEECERLFPESEVIVCNDREGNGKGWALREALKHAERKVICFLDGDLDISAKMILRLLPFLDTYDIVVGNKKIRGKIIRKLVTWFSRIFVRILFGLNFDTQTGIKIFKREALPEWLENGFLFDVEVLLKAKKAGFKIIEIPVEVTPYGSTSKGIRSKGVFRCFCAAIKIWINNI